MKIIIVKKAEVKSAADASCPWVVEYMTPAKEK